MNSAAHHGQAEAHVAQAIQAESEAEERYHLALAQVHATLALAPAPPPSAPPSQRIDTSRPTFVRDIEAMQIHISKASTGGVYIAQERSDLDDDQSWGVVIEDPAQLRLFAAVLTAHADRLESKP